MSTYSTNLRITLIGTGEEQGTWGNTTNTNLGTLLEQAITGYAAITVSDIGDTTLTTANGSSDQARNMVLNLTGTISAARNVICPGTPKVYIVKNATTGGFAVTFKVSGQTGVLIPNGAIYLIYVDGTDARQATGDVTSGGTGLSSYTTGDILYASGTSTIAKLADVATGNALISGGVGVAPSYGKIGLTTHVSGTLPATNGGTGLSTYAVGDIVYANTTSTLASLAGVATGNALISGGVGTAPSYGKIGLTTHVSGTLPVANGGTGVTTSTGSGANVLGTAPTISAAVLTGNSVAVTATAGTNTTQIATTAFVKTAIDNALPTALYDIGGFIIGRPKNSTNYAVNSTVSGSSLYATSVAGVYSSGDFSNQSGETLVNTGSWRCTSPAWGNGGSTGQAGLWVRYA